ncbi:nose resistant to fluoxetine protein 6-like [Episyrphus balteatus]|uniref:nose resistant to fluoxetine protein 6-like n=1 Tax=Episyrphus balteatus TaxID=286459 RepID=UPI002485C5DD|nr:nose resistant to fluoxetine protein 6-like [Episyrphus balteatus]
MYFPIFLVLTLTLNEINSLTIFNNVSVSSDVLSQVFLREIQQNPNKVYESDVADYGQYDSQKCLFSLREIIKRYPSQEVAPFFDAWGNMPAGISSGNEYDLGNYDQCVKLSLNFNELGGVIKQQYCFATLPTKEEHPLKYNTNTINIGICIPNTCSPELVTKIFIESTENSFDGALSNITVGHCSDGKTPPLSGYIIAGISIFVILTVLMILSSAYDLYVSYYEKKPNTVLLAFSILTNGKRLFAISTKKSRNSIDCLIGIRVLSTFWIINHHTYTNMFGSPFINNLDIEDWVYSWIYMPFYNANISVDTFFFMGGLLVAWIGFKELDKTNGKINPIMNIVHRYFRLTPILAAGLLITYSIRHLLYTGPMKDVYMAKNTCNGYNWWPVLLYIQNYYSEQKSDCYKEAWYLAIDFQLYALSPLILVPMWKWGKKFAPVLLVLGLISIGWNMGIFFSKQYTGLVLGFNDHEWNTVYIPTHTRYSPWLVGFAFGYFMHKNRQSEFKLSKTVQIIGWIGSFFTITAIVFGPIFSLQANDGTGTVFEAAMYESLKRCSWAVAHAWITFACHYGYGGFVDTFLSHPFWQPLGRLSYALYMMHMTVLLMNFGMTRTEIYFSVYNQFLIFWSTLGITLFVAIYVTLAFESPILILEKLIFNREKSVPKETVLQAFPSSIVVETVKTSSINNIVVEPAEKYH